jgi:hypothetical protein
LKVAGWNMFLWNTLPWNGVFSIPAPLSPPPPPPPLRLRERTRRVGVHNVTIRQETVVVNQQARVFFEFDGVTGLDKINPKDFDC